jgi:hypothetical protein
MKKPVVALVASGLFYFGTIVQAQNIIPASGGNASGSEGSFSYTIGQVVYITNSGSDGSVAHGVQQPYEISVISGIEDALGISLELSVYPNPVTDRLMLKINDYQTIKLKYQLYDINGSILQENKVDGQNTSIEMGKYVSAIYLLKVTDNKKVIKTFRIIKN